MPKATLTISSKNYSSWSLRGWLLCKLSGIDFDEVVLSLDDPTARAELLHLSPSFLVPCLTHNGIKVWDTIAIAEYLAEIRPADGLYPADRAERAHCRSVSCEMHQGFFNLRSALPMNLKAHYPNFSVWTGVQAEVSRIASVWQECLTASSGPYLFGARMTVADAMYAPVCTRFHTYDVRLDGFARDYCALITSVPAMVEWTEAAKAEPEDLDEIDAEF